jgi:hypothetical protein
MTNQEVLTTQILIINHLVQLLYNLVAFGFFFLPSLFSLQLQCLAAAILTALSARLRI